MANGNGNGKNGRPSEITTEIIDKITSAIRAGNYIETASGYAGVHKDTLYAWMKRGARSLRAKNPLPEDELYRNFSDAIEKALADSEAHDVTIIAQAARGGAVVARKVTVKTAANGDVTETTVEELAAPVWQAAAWRLERKFPDRWGRRIRLGDETSEDAPFVIKLVQAERPGKEPES